MRCVRPDLSCDLLKQIYNGTFTVTGDYFNAKVTYMCNKGFFISGPKERVCQGDGSWSSSSPVCTKYGKNLIFIIFFFEIKKISFLSNPIMC